MAFSTRLRTARSSISALPWAQTGSGPAANSSDLCSARAMGAIKATTSAPSSLRLTSFAPAQARSFPAPPAPATGPAHGPWRRYRTAAPWLRSCSSIVSTWVRRMARGVRNSCAASAVNSRCACRLFSSRSSAWLTALANGITSRGSFPVGRRTSGLSGPIEEATCEAAMMGCSRRRISSTSTNSRTTKIGNDQPCDAAQEQCHHIVNDDVRIFQILPHLNPGGAALPANRQDHAVIDRSAAALVKESRLGAPRLVPDERDCRWEARNRRHAHHPPPRPGRSRHNPANKLPAGRTADAASSVHSPAPDAEIRWRHDRAGSRSSKSFTVALRRK